MKLKYNLSRKDKNTGKEFYRWDFTIDPEFIEQLGWKKGQEFSCKIQGKKLIIEKG